MYKIGGYSIEDIQEFFLDKSRHNKKMKTPLSEEAGWRRFNNYQTDEYNGLFMNQHNTVVVIKEGVLHNDAGPAKVILTKEGKPYYSLFARKGKIIPFDDFEAILRQSKVKRVEKQYNIKKEKEMKKRLQVDKEIIKDAVLEDLLEFIMQKSLERIKDPDDAMEVAERIHEELTEETYDLGAENVK